MTEARLHEALAAWNTGDADRVLAVLERGLHLPRLLRTRSDGSQLHRPRRLRARASRRSSTATPDGEFADTEVMVAGNRGAAEWTFRANDEDGSAVRGARLRPVRVRRRADQDQERVSEGARDSGLSLRDLRFRLEQRRQGVEVDGVALFGRFTLIEQRREREERRDERGSKWLPLAVAISSRMRAQRPRFLVRPFGSERVVDVADGADAALERDLLAFQAMGVAGAVPALWWVRAIASAIWISGEADPQGSRRPSPCAIA